MTIQPGQELLHYRIVDKLGEGGMGVVWRAVDTSLDREVAIKLLPAAGAGDADRLARFDREAKLLASLNHPNIAGIYGAFEVDGTRFLAMELVEGEDLSQRLLRGAVPVGEAVEIAREIASALEAAHDSGVIHRDLKPANVKLMPDGRVKVLDFGLAKALSPEAASVDLSNSPTLTSEGTVPGVILGTAAYMSPEQAKGKAVDRRADVWSFGCVLYECLTGRKAFVGATLSEILAEVLKSEPDWRALPPSTSPAVRRLLRRCLAKDPRERLRDLGDARLELSDDEPAERGGDAGPATRPSRIGSLAGWIAAAVLLVVVVLQFASRAQAPTTAASRPLHAEVSLPENARLGFGVANIGVDSNLLALSPDGTLLVYVGRSADGTSRLYRRDLSSFDAPQEIPGTEGAHHAVFSPDGQSVAFLTASKLKRVAPNGDDLRTLAQATNPVRAQWAVGDVIYLGADQGRRLQRVPAGGGLREDLHFDQRMLFLEVLPHGRSALVMLRRGINADFGEIALLDLATLELRTVLEGGYDARLVGPDRLVFARGGNLLAVPFDVEEGRVTGEPVTVLRDVVMDAILGQAQFAFSDSGTMVFARGPELSRGGVARIGRDGSEEFLEVEQGAYGVIDLDPTDQKLVLEVADVESYVWVYDIPSGRGMRLPGRRTSSPVWSRDGETVGYSDNSEKILRLEAVGGTATKRSAVPNEGLARISSWSPDDRVLAIQSAGGAVSTRIGFLDLDSGETSWLDSGDNKYALSEFSPDGRWLAYSSNETGTWEVWIRSWPDGNVVRQISDGGGLETVWLPTGELFYRRGDAWMSVMVTTEPALNWTAPQQVFQTDFVDTLGRSYDVSSDGQSLYVVKQPHPPDGSRVHVVTSWTPGR